jgi:iron complex outermembrane receptor protein
MPRALLFRRDIALKTTTRRARLMASSMIGGLALVAAPAAFAADANSSPLATADASATAPAAANTPIKKLTESTDASGPAASTTEVVVTGSRIPQPNLTSVSPVTSVTNEEIKTTGTVNIEDLLNNLPQVAAEQGGSISNGATGTATVNLRNLGSNRTLVLIDGRRLGPGDPTEPVADLNFIPTQLVDRVEIDTAGASSVYGSDAVGGVVNFIMKKDYEGVSLDANYGFYNHDNGNSGIENLVKARNFALPPSQVNDGGTSDFSAIFGVNAPDGKGNITGYATYRHLDPIDQASRDFSACSLGDSKSGFACSGSSTSATGAFYVFDQNFNYFKDTVTGTGANSSFRPFTSADQYNFAPTNFYQRSDDTITSGFFAHYDVNSHFQPYLQFMFMDDHTDAQIAPSGAFGQTFTIPCTDPLLTAAEMTTLCGPGTTTPGPAGTATLAIARRNVEGGNRVDDLRHTDYRTVLGAKGAIDANWQYDAFFQYGASLFAEEYRNDVSLYKTGFAVDNCVGAPTSGFGSGCVPWNIFQGGGVSKAAVNYIESPGFEEGQDTEMVIEADVNGNLGAYGVKSPWATDAVAVSFGVDNRRETLSFKTDAEFSSGDLAGQGGPTIGDSGAYSLWEVYGETRIPIIQDQPFFKSLVLNGSYRYSDYNTFGGTNTYSVGPTWNISDDVMLRVGYNVSIRAPSVIDLFKPDAVGLDFSNDPCASPTPSATAAQCARTGVSASQYGHIAANPANQYNGLLGGNANLQPETADTYSAGIVLTPHQIPRFSFSADYFHIDVQNAIGGIGAQTTIDQCVATGNPLYCSLIHRAPGTGSLFLGTSGYITDTSQNVAQYETSGIDFAANYRVALEDWHLGPYGSLDFDFKGTYTIDYNVTSAPGLGSFDCVGYYGTVCQGTGTPMTAPTPAWRSTFRIAWATPWAGLGFSGQWRYIGSLNVDASSPNPLLSDPSLVFPVDEHLSDVSYFDLEASWRANDQYTFRVGVNNIFDQDPPLIGSNNTPGVVGNGNTFPQFYDALGRYIFFNVSANF